MLRIAQVLGVGLMVIGVAMTVQGAQAQESFPLDEYPGFGRSPGAALRDDTIAAWEAFRREQTIASCMERAAFEYSPAVHFPSQALLAVAEGLGVNVNGPVALAPWDRNAAYESGLSAEERERFNRSLFGESAADMAAVQSTGRFPAGRSDDFATGGCVREATRGSQSVWTLNRELTDEIELMRREIAISPELASTAASYSGCATQVAGISAGSPSDVETLISQGGAQAEAARKVAEECRQVWTSGYRHAEVTAARRFEDRNEAALGAAQSRYRGVMSRISADEGFLAYLGMHARALPLGSE